MKFTFIEQHASTWPVNVMCRMLGVSRSGYYDWRGRAPSARMTANLALLVDVRRLQVRHQGRYGSPGCMPPCGRRAIDAAAAASSG